MAYIDDETMNDVVKRIEYLMIFKYLYDEGYDVSGIGFEINEYDGYGEDSISKINELILGMLLGDYNDFTEIDTEPPISDYTESISSLEIKIDGISDFITREDIKPLYDAMVLQVKAEYYSTDYEPTFDVKDDLITYTCDNCYSTNTMPYLDYDIVKSINEFKKAIIAEGLIK